MNIRFIPKRVIVIACSVSAMAVAAVAALPPAARIALDRAISDAVENAHSGSEITWTSGAGYGGHITVDRAYSLSTGQVCTDGCSDPCRPVDYQVSSSESLTAFHGVRCRQVEDDGSVRWVMHGSDTITRHMTLMNGTESGGNGLNQTAQTDVTPHPATDTAIPATKSQQPAHGPKARKRLAVQIQQKLARLLYYSGTADGAFGAGSISALHTFLEDERSSLQPTPSEEVLMLLTLAEARAVHGSCPHPSGVNASDTVACATLSG